MWPRRIVQVDSEKVMLVGWKFKLVLVEFNMEIGNEISQQIRVSSYDSSTFYFMCFSS